MASLDQPHWETISPKMRQIVEFVGGQDKYPYVRDFGMMVLTAMVDFTIAEKQADIDTAPNVDWSVVKAFFVQEARRIGRSWFE